MKFMTVNKKIIRLENVGIKKPTLLNKIKITLLNVAYYPKSNSNLISLSWLRETRISYHVYPESMILLKKARNIIDSA